MTFKPKSMDKIFISFFVHMDYVKLIETLNTLDSDGDCALTLPEFTDLCKKMSISESKDFVQLVFTGLSNRTDVITFNDARAVYEASFRGIKTKAMSVILFRCVDVEQKRKISIDCFKKIGNILGESDEELEIKFNRCDKQNTGTVTYYHVAKSLFGIHVSKKENPHKLGLLPRSVETGCCVVM